MSWHVEEEGLLSLYVVSLGGLAGCRIYSTLGVSTHHKLFDITEGCAFSIRLSPGLHKHPCIIHEGLILKLVICFIAKVELQNAVAPNYESWRCFPATQKESTTSYVFILMKRPSLSFLWGAWSAFSGLTCLFVFCPFRHMLHARPDVCRCTVTHLLSAKIHIS